MDHLEREDLRCLLLLLLLLLLLRWTAYPSVSMMRTTFDPLVASPGSRIAMICKGRHTIVAAAAAARFCIEKSVSLHILRPLIDPDLEPSGSNYIRSVAPKEAPEAVSDAAAKRHSRISNFNKYLCCCHSTCQTFARANMGFTTETEGTLSKSTGTDAVPTAMYRNLISPETSRSIRLQHSTSPSHYIQFER